MANIKIKRSFGRRFKRFLLSGKKKRTPRTIDVKPIKTSSAGDKKIKVKE